MRVRAGTHVGAWAFWIMVPLALVFAAPASAKRNDDVVVMKNGDRFTGEIKQMTHGLLYFKSSYMVNSVQLDWNEVATLQSQDPYLITLTSGMRLAGTIERTTEKESGKEKFAMKLPAQGLDVEPKQVIQIQQLEQSFWKQLNGDVNAGFSYTSGSNPTTGSVSVDATYTNDRNVVSGSTSTQFSTQTNAANTFRFTFNSQYSRIFRPTWYWFGLFDLLKSDQQDLSLRTTYGGGLGKQLVRTDRSLFGLGGGLVYSREHYSTGPGPQPYTNSLEGLIGAKYVTFRFKTLDVSWNGQMFPSITDAGRVRFSTTGSIKIELVKDLYWNFQLYENYDTRPPVSAPKNDFGLTTSLGWKF